MFAIPFFWVGGFFKAGWLGGGTTTWLPFVIDYAILHQDFAVSALNSDNALDRDELATLLDDRSSPSQPAEDFRGARNQMSRGHWTAR